MNSKLGTNHIPVISGETIHLFLLSHAVLGTVGIWGVAGFMRSENHFPIPFHHHNKNTHAMIPSSHPSTPFPFPALFLKNEPNIAPRIQRNPTIITPPMSFSLVMAPTGLRAISRYVSGIISTGACQFSSNI